MADLTPRAKAKRDQISAAARQLFLSRGFAATSMDAIATEAGVSKQTLYTYFPGKEDLLIAVLRELIHDFPLGTGSGRPEIKTKAELQRMLRHLARDVIAGIMQPDYVALVRVIVAETPRLPQLGQLFCSAVPNRILQSVAALIDQARQQGLVECDDTDAAARLFMGPLLTYVLIDGLFAVASPPVQPAARQLDAVVDLFVKALSR